MAKPDWLTKIPIAHRGYHNLALGAAENSMSAFSAAIDHGFAIECDLQVSATGEPVVFHDPLLGRMTGIDGTVRNHTPAELASMKLLNTQDGIYTLKQHLDLVAGRVPLVLELKGVEGEDAGFVEGVADALSAYDRPVCVMSFDHWICQQFHTLLPQIARGLTAEGDDAVHDIHQAAMNEYDLQFVSYSVSDLPCRFVKDVRDRGLPVISWTVRSPQQAEHSARYADQITFEGFDPGTGEQFDPRAGAHG